MKNLELKIPDERRNITLKNTENPKKREKTHQYQRMR